MLKNSEFTKSLDSIKLISRAVKLLKDVPDILKQEAYLLVEDLIDRHYNELKELVDQTDTSQDFGGKIE